MMRFPLTIPTILDRAAAHFPGVRIASLGADRTLVNTNYLAFAQRARSLAANLIKAGMRRGDRVATMMWNHAAHLECYFGIPSAGGVVHPVNIRLHADEIVYIMNHAGDRFLIIDESLLPVWNAVRDRVKVEIVIVVAGASGAPAGTLDYESFLAPGAGNYNYPSMDENEAAAMCYTSGTTGRPRGVLYSHRSIVLHSFAVMMADTFAMSQKDRLFIISPMFHVNGWGMPHAAVMAGAEIVMNGMNFSGDAILDIFESQQITVTGAVPTIWQSVREALEREPARWKFKNKIRGIVGGAAPSGALLRALDSFGIELIHAWGMTETSPLATFGTLKSQLNNLTEKERMDARLLQGWTVPFVETRVVNDAGRIARADGAEMGELQARGPWVAGSYYQNPESADRWTDDGWFRSGDIAVTNENGYIQIVDRAKDLIKSGGEWISSVDLENTLMGHPAVREAAVIGIAHPKWQERPLAIVVLREGALATAGDFARHLECKFAKWQLPDAYEFVEMIPRTSVGKINKLLLREQYKHYKWTQNS